MIGAVAPADAQTVEVTAGDLESGGAITIEFLVTVNSPVPPGTTQVSNQGTVTGANLAPAVLTDDPDAGGGADPTVTPLDVQVDLVVSKSESADPVVAGSGAGNLTYVVTVFNNSLYSATGVVVSEAVTVPAGVGVDSVTPSQGAFTDPDWSVGTLMPGASATLTVVLTVGPSAAAGTDVVCDTATVTASNETRTSTGDDTATECTSVARQVDLVVSKGESADPVIAGSGTGNLTYVVTVENAGPSDASGVTLSEVLNLPAGVGVASVTPSQGSFASPTWTVGGLASGASATLTVVLTVGPSAAAGSDVVCDTATVTGSNETRISTGDDTATECTSVVREIDLVVSKGESADPVIAGSGAGNLTYVVTVENAGPSDASGVTLSEVLTLPSGVSLQSATPGQGSFASPTWTVGGLAAGGSATLTVVLTVGPSTVAGSGVVCDTATVTGSNEPRISTGDDAATECTSVERRVDAVVTVADSPDPAIAGSGPGNLTHVVTFTNAGPSNASGVVVGSSFTTLAAGVTVDSATPSQGTYVGTTWNVGGVAAGGSATLTFTLTVGAAVTPGADRVCKTSALSGMAEPAINPGDESEVECTAVAVAADLSITKEDDADPPPAGSDLTYTITVHNAGPSTATNVVVTDPLPAAVSYVSDTCSGADLPPWTWNVGSLAAGASASCDVVVSIDPSPPGSIFNTASVASDVFDDDTSNNSDTEETVLDNVLPEVVEVDSTGTTPGGSLDECETARTAIGKLLVTFSEEVVHAAAADPASAVNPASYRLVRPATAGSGFDTASCAGGTGGDTVIPVSAVSYAAGSDTATLTVNGGAALPDGLYRLLVCGSIEDLAGNPLDGGAGAGTDFARTFRVDRDNLLDGGHFDDFDPVACTLAAWSSTAPAAVELADPDADGSPLSGSAHNTAALTGFDLSQCVPVAGGQPYRLESSLRVVAAPGVLVGFEARCRFFSAAACTGGAVGQAILPAAVGGTGGSFLAFHKEGVVPPPAASARCTFTVRAPAAGSFDAYLDRAFFGHPGLIFADGFESGDTSAWSAAVP